MSTSRWWVTAAAAVMLSHAHQRLGLEPGLPGPAAQIVLVALANALPGVMVLVGTVGPGHDRRWGRLVGWGLLMLAVGRTAHEVQELTSTLPPGTPHAAGLVAYPLLLGGLALALREELRNVRLVLGVDGLTGCLAGTAAVTMLLGPLMARALDGTPGMLVPFLVGLCDAALVAVALGAVGIASAGRRRTLVLVALGLTVFAVVDVVHIYGDVLDRTVMPSWLELVGLLGLLVVVAGVGPRRDGSPEDPPHAGNFGVPVLAAVVAVLVLALSPTWSEQPLPATLAVLALTGCAVRVGLIFRDLRDLAAIRRQALTDELTGAANRRALYQHLDELFAARPELATRPETPSRPASARSKTADPVEARVRAGDPVGGTATTTAGGDEPKPFALALVDLDHFKEVNDTLGHAAGDELLKVVVARFATALAELETPHLLARLGGDEFAVVLHEVGTRNAALIVGEALRDSLAQPVQVDDAVLHAQASFGLALVPEHGTDRSDILFAADAAMYEAKTSGSTIAVHSPSRAGDRRQRLAVAESLFRALERRELTVAYQPIMTPRRELVAAEALVRWQHPERGLVLPGEFLEAAERYKLTHKIAERVLDVSLGDLSRWRAAGVPMTLSINISASDLRDEEIVNLVAASLLEHHLPPEVLTVEVTENAMMADPECSREVMRALDEMGVRLSVDDYGTGYSSLQRLLDLPIDEIKLGHTFVAEMAHQLRARAIVASTIDLTHALGLRMVAEGVENRQTLEALADLRCDLVQGFHLGRPVDAGSFGHLLPPPQLPPPPLDEGRLRTEGPPGVPL